MFRIVIFSLFILIAIVQDVNYAYLLQGTDDVLIEESSQSARNPFFTFLDSFGLRIAFILVIAAILNLITLIFFKANINANSSPAGAYAIWGTVFWVLLIIVGFLTFIDLLIKETGFGDADFLTALQMVPMLYWILLVIAIIVIVIIFKNRSRSEHA